jgi:TPR repeat protein
MKKAIGSYQQAAELVNPIALNKLGDCYEKGESVPQDLEKAIQYYHQSAEMRNTRSMLNLSRCYLTGAGVVRTTDLYN